MEAMLRWRRHPRRELSSGCCFLSPHLRKVALRAGGRRSQGRRWLGQNRHNRSRISSQNRAAGRFISRVRKATSLGETSRVFFGRRIVKQGNGLPDWIRKSSIAGLVLMAGSVAGWTQEASAPATPQPDAMTAAVRELQEQVRELRAAVLDVRSEAAQYRAETAELRRELQSARGQLAASSVPLTGSQLAPSVAGAGNPQSANSSSEPAKEDALEGRVAALEESSQLLNSKVDDQYQTKVESASKYRVRLSGVVLLNLFSNRGTSDNQDFPTWATPSSPSDPKGTFGVSLRQSELGLEIFGPRVAGAKTAGNLQFDFSGGFPNTFNGVS